MSVFSYTALNSKKNKVNGKIEASSIREVRENLRLLELVPLRIEEIITEKPLTEKKAKKPIKKENAKPAKISRYAKITLREKIDFVNTLSILIKTGIPLIEALLFIELNSSGKNVPRIAGDLKKMILGGSNLSDAMSKFPKIFDHIFLGLVRAGEETGELDVTLKRIMHILTKQNRLRGKIISLSIYPCIVILLALVVTTVMLTFVFPAFKEMYDQMGGTLPLITQVFMSIGTFLRKHLFVIPVGFGLFFYTIFLIVKHPIAKKIFDEVSLVIPLVKVFALYAALSNFVSVLKVCFDAGIPVLDSIMLSNRTINNYLLKYKLNKAAARIQQGQSLSASLKQTGVFPSIIMCMISTGEEAGKLGETLGHSEVYIDEQLDKVIDILSRLVEPLLVVVIGGLVMALALALYLPLFKAYSNIG